MDNTKAAVYVDQNEDNTYSVSYVTARGAIYEHSMTMNKSNAHLVGMGVEDLIQKGEQPKLADHWHHIRNTYGSPSWSQADEVGLMDEEERMHRGHG
jgi:hypothetical protein